MVPGKFRARALEGALGRTQDGKGNPQVAVLFEILDEDFRGETITWFGFFTDKTTENTLAALRIAGWSGDDLWTLEGLGSTEVQIVVEEEEDQEGVLRLKVRWVNRVGGQLALKSRMNEAEGRAFAMQMRGPVIASRKVKPSIPYVEPGAATPTPPPSVATSTARQPQPLPPPTGPRPTPPTNGAGATRAPVQQDFADAVYGKDELPF